MNLDIRLSGMVDTMSPTSAKALAATPDTGAAGDNVNTSFSAMLARLAAAGTGKLPAIAGSTAVPATGSTGLSAESVLPETAASLPDNLLTDLPGFHPPLAGQGAAQPNATAGADSDLPPVLNLLASEAADAAENSTAEAAAPADIQADAAAGALAALQAFAADGRAGIPAAATATASAASLGGTPPLQSARPAPATAAARQALAQHGSGALHAGATDTAALLPGGITDSSFALADHELEQGVMNGKAASQDSGLHHSALLPLMHNQGAGQASVAGSASATLASPLASPQWQQEFSQQMVGLVQRGEQRVSLHLNPAELGPLVVDLKLSEHQALLQFASAHAQVRSALEQALPQLREALAEQGISLGETHIGSERGEQQASAFHGGAQEAGHDSVRAGAKPELAPEGASAGSAMPLDGRVNLYV